MGWKEIKEFIETAGEGLRADRERALLCVAYDTMARRSELVALNLEDVTFMPNGSGTILIRRSKTDREGQGATGYLSGNTVKRLQCWMESAAIREGAIFRRLVGKNRVGERLHADIIADIYKRIARWIQMPAKQVAQVSGHSVRIGATQDMLVLNIDLASSYAGRALEVDADANALWGRSFGRSRGNGESGERAGKGLTSSLRYPKFRCAHQPELTLSDSDAELTTKSLVSETG